MFSIGHPSKKSSEEFRSSVNDMDHKGCNLLLQEHCKKLFLLLDCLWDDFKDFSFDLKWLLKVKNYLDKLERKLR